MTNQDGKTQTTMSPDEAFNTLGNETRMEILQTLAEADEPLMFRELRKRVGLDDPGNFNYHLNKLKGQFVRKTDGGYKLTQSGNHVYQAILSGTVTQTPTVEPTELDERCYHCGN
ncbi:MAG: helix-turn-helix domain-containing protein, partial [Halobacteria archaeon]|nr:helix-turn-helix domain-containing protein [Halobacteria archaeon]